MKKNCLNCTHFKIWDGDPCCLHKDEWKIVLPTLVCENYDRETFKPVLELKLYSWNECKEQFFNSYTIDHQDMIDTYLEMFPEDRELIYQEQKPL